MRNQLASAALALGLVTTASGSAHAQTAPTAQAAKAEAEYARGDALKKPTTKATGWSYALTLAANMNVASNRDVVGQLNGNSFLFGGGLLAGGSYYDGKHEWTNSGTVNEAWSRTPALDRFTKSNDVVDLQTLYNYFLTDVTGPFARIGLQTTLFKTDRITPQTITYTSADGTETITTNRLRLSDGLQPFTISESLGWFVQPLHSDQLNVYAKAGAGGRHTFADGARAVTGDTSGTAITFQQLSDVHQAGAELFAGIDGKQVNGRLLYSAVASALFPFLNNDDADRSVGKLTKITLATAVGVGVFSWLAINYQLKVVRDVQLVDAIQVQNALLLSLQYTLTSPKPGEAAAADATQARIAELEARATAAEQRAAAAEQRAAAAAAAAGLPEPEPLPEPTAPAPTTPSP